MLDIRLPDGSGFELLAELRRVHSPLDLPVIVISGLDEAHDIVAALHAGANDYVAKPFDLAVVLARVRTQLELRRLERLHDQFLRVASHDLKRPLLLILDAARQLGREFPVGAPMTEDGHATLCLLIESGQYMQQIIEDMLKLRAVRDGRLHLARRPTDLGALVRQVIARHARYAEGKQIALEMRFEPGMPPVEADDLRIMQVLENLIGNAIKFCPPGSRVTVYTRRDGEALVCEVSDTGPGIAPEDMERLFVEYARLRNRPTGGETSTGLGLAISKQLIRLHGGEIGARNNPGGGATFWFRLPLDPGRARRSENLSPGA